MNSLLIIPAYAWLLFSAICFAVGEYLSKKWGMQPSLAFALVVAIPYVLGVFAWLPSLLHKNQLSTMGTAWTLLSVMATLGIAFLIFHEKLNGYNIAGLLLAIVAIILLQI